MEDRLLVLRCKQGSRDALRRIYEKYRDYLLILAIALSHDVNLGEDAVHDAFVVFAEKLERFELTGSLKAAYLEQDCTAASDLSEPGGRIVCNERLQQLSSTLAELAHEQREVIALRIYGQMRFGAIAKSLGISVNTVKGRYRYGIAKMRSILNSEVEK